MVVLLLLQVLVLTGYWRYGILSLLRGGILDIGRREVL
jgi:hypothetical protein